MGPSSVVRALVWDACIAGIEHSRGAIFLFCFPPFQSVTHGWYILGDGMCCPVCGKVHIKYPLMLMEELPGFSKTISKTVKCLTSNSWWFKEFAEVMLLNKPK